MTGSPERRQGRRLFVAGRPEGRVKAALEAHLIDLSVTGARIEHYSILRPGFVCILEFPAGLVPLTLSVQVVRSTVAGHETTAGGERLLRYESGLAFINVTPDQRQVLEGLLTRLEPGAALGNGRLRL